LDQQTKLNFNELYQNQYKLATVWSVLAYYSTTIFFGRMDHRQVVCK
jgi:hypothetical protein